MNGLAAGVWPAFAAVGDATLVADAATTADLAAGPVAQSGSLTERALTNAVRVLALAVLAAGTAAAVALLYRWYVRERVPGELPALFGLSAVAVVLNTDQALGEVIAPDGSGDPLDQAGILFHVVTFLVALAATRAGADVGDRLGSDVAVATGERAVETEVSRVVQAVGRVITVELPDEVEDIVGYDPVPAETKEKLAGKTFVFPRRLTVDELRDRLVTRLKADYGVGHVDLELADDGSVEYLAVGSRAAGIGPTLPPETSAVAVKADPAFAASAGDLVQVWRTDPFERVVTAELRGVVDDVATLAIDAADTRKLDAEGEYKLVTLPVETRPDREFASVLRVAEETMAAVTVGAGSDLAGQPVGAIDVTVVAIRPESGPVEPLPARDRTLAPGDAVYIVAAPEAIRKVEAAATPRDGATPEGTGVAGAALTPDEQIDPGRAVGEGSDDGETPTDALGAGGNGTPAESAADPLVDADAPGIEALEPDESDPSSNGEPVEDETAEPDDGAADSDDGAAEPDGSAAEPDEGPEADDPSPEADGRPDEPSAEPTREDLGDLPGADVDELTGTDASDEAAVGDDWETIAGPDASEETAAEAEPSDGEAESGDDTDEAESGDSTDDADADGDDSAESSGSDWTVAVDQRREDDE
ncbi:TrkA C-terminal domain-containing protein [Halosimplex pelagicum]|uniref:Potassium transporter TrkA n=1 Tax=Halosimplex pelagicum TaxID=869886 RepID=A0A7D5P7E7_9EURY|nr:TrkA C-terminal domain-containing protein [Halosimplex pelagicum]QLH80384.1 potassium transporter TrkA [Halosimplex pelagicum]